MPNHIMENPEQTLWPPRPFLSPRHILSDSLFYQQRCDTMGTQVMYDCRAHLYRCREGFRTDGSVCSDCPRAENIPQWASTAAEWSFSLYVFRKDLQISRSTSWHLWMRPMLQLNPLNLRKSQTNKQIRTSQKSGQEMFCYFCFVRDLICWFLLIV